MVFKVTEIIQYGQSIIVCLDGQTMYSNSIDNMHSTRLDVQVVLTFGVQVVLISLNLSKY